MSRQRYRVGWRTLSISSRLTHPKRRSYQLGRMRCDDQTPMNTSAECADVEFETRSLPNLLVATLATLPSMSLIPSAPFPICGNRRQCARCNREKILLRQGYGGTSVVVQAPTGSRKTYINLHQRRVTSDERSITFHGRASSTRAHALHPNLPRSPIMHHKPLMMRAKSNGNSKFV